MGEHAQTAGSDPGREAGLLSLKTVAVEEEEEAAQGREAMGTVGRDRGQAVGAWGPDKPGSSLNC